MSSHPNEMDLALLASGDVGRIQRFSLDRHLRNCSECSQKVEQFENLRANFILPEPADLSWNRLASEMRANIRLGLEAGECVRRTPTSVAWGLGLAAAFAGVLVLASAGVFLRERPPVLQGSVGQAPVVQTTAAGIELRTGSTSLTLLNREGAVASQTVSAQGEVRSRSIDGETGAVTINNVYLVQ
jgi:hypothetical protein